eukprot:363254-Chlamydomonas_euryale.AAC.9
MSEVLEGALEQDRMHMALHGIAQQLATTLNVCVHSGRTLLCEHEPDVTMPPFLNVSVCLLGSTHSQASHFHREGSWSLP